MDVWLVPKRSEMEETPLAIRELIFEILGGGDLDRLLVICEASNFECNKNFWKRVALELGKPVGDIFLEATRGGYLNVVDSLLESDSIVNFQNERGETALMMAAKNGRLEVVNRLLQVRGIDVNLHADAHKMDGNTAFTSAAWAGYPKIVDRLLKVPGIDVNFQNSTGDTALMLAAIGGDFSSPDEYYEQLENEWDEVGEAIGNVLRDGADSGRALVSRLETEGWDRDDFEETLDDLQLGEGGEYWWGKDFMYNRHLEVVTRLLKVQGINVNLRNNFGETPLIAAAAKGLGKIVDRLLAEKGIDVTARDNSGMTALKAAAREGHHSEQDLADVRRALYDVLSNEQKKYIEIVFKLIDSRTFGVT